MKKTFTGWIAKDEVDLIGYTGGQYDDDHAMPHIRKTKGKESDWYRGEWPPIKVKVTVETVEK